MTQKSVRILFGPLVAMLVVVGTAVAGPLEDAAAALTRGDYSVAMPSYGRWPTKVTPPPKALWG
jgi:hypothetical protein